MNYIVLDLEWNQSAKGKKYSIKGMPFEIIQIGAVKLDENFALLDEFDVMVKPQIYTRLHSIIGEVTGISQQMLSEGVHFVDACEDFLEWCKKDGDYIFCIWGSTDLTELQRNINFYDIHAGFANPFIFYDIQKLFSIQYMDGKERISLQAAIEKLGLSMESQYHMAINDARYTATVMRYLEFSKLSRYFSVDTYRIPANKKQEYTFNFGEYTKYVSRGFSTREKAASDREVRSCRCVECGKPMERCIKWFAVGKTHYGLFKCQEHGLEKGKFRTKSTDDDRYYAIKIIKKTDEAGVEKIKSRQKNEREKRRRRRLQK